MSAIQISQSQLLQILGGFDAPISADDLATVCQHKNTNKIVRVLQSLAKKGEVVQVNGGWRRVEDVELDAAQEAANVLARWYTMAGDKQMAELMEIERERMGTKVPY